MRDLRQALLHLYLPPHRPRHLAGLTLEAERKELERQREEASARLRARLARKTERIAAERQSCRPDIAKAGVVGTWFGQGDVVAALRDSTVPAMEVYREAIPFLLGEEGEYPDIEEAFVARLFQDIEDWRSAAKRRSGDALASWSATLDLLRRSCFHDLADFVVVAVAVEAADDLRTIVFWEIAFATPDVDLTRLAHPSVVRALERVPHSILRDTLVNGHLVFMPAVIEANLKAVGVPFVVGCVKYFNDQTELREGRGLTAVQHAAFTGLCECIHAGLSGAPLFVSFTALVEDLAGLRFPLSDRDIAVRKTATDCGLLLHLDRK